MSIKALISRKAAYKEGYEAGKLAATKQLFEEFEQMLEETRLEADNKKSRSRYDYSCNFYNGKVVVCLALVTKLHEIKRRRGVK